jgi:4-carboxymuconolactone decarboxylase
MPTDTAAADIAPLGRYPGIAAADLTDDQRAALTSVTGLRGGVPAPYRAWLESPGIVRHMAALGNYLRGTSLTERELELAVLALAHALDCPFVQEAHRKIGLRVGLPADIPATIAAGGAPALADARERLVFAVAQALAAPAAMPADLARRAEAGLGHAMIVEIIALLGLYTSVCHTMKFYAVPAPPA